MAKWSRLAALAILVSPLVGFACSSFSEDDETTPDGAVTSDAPAPTSETSTPLPPPDTQLADLEQWQVFTLPAGPYESALLGFGGVFDGEHVYLAGGKGLMARFDTKSAGIADAAAWEYFDVRKLDAGGPEAGSDFITLNPGVVGDDGRVYFPASYNSVYVQQQRSFRFDPTKDFGDASSWEYFNTRQEVVPDGSAPFSGAFRADGSVGFLPYQRRTADGEEATPLAYAVTTAAGAKFSAKTSWTTTDPLGGQGKLGEQLTGAAVVGDYVYAANQRRSEAARLDLAMTTVKRFPTDSLYPSGRGVAVVGATTDGRYVYFTPYHFLDIDGEDDDTATPASALLRYDTQQEWGMPSSYEVFDLMTLDPKNVGFVGGAFDGRFMYFLTQKTNHLVRYDTLGAFSAASSYETLDIMGKGIDVDETRLGMVFDGQYIYLVPSGGLSVARFRARNTPLPGAGRALSNF